MIFKSVIACCLAFGCILLSVPAVHAALLENARPGKISEHDAKKYQEAPPAPIEAKVEETITRQDFLKAIEELRKKEEVNIFPKGSKMHDIFEHYLQEMFNDDTVMEFIIKSTKENSGHVKDYKKFGEALFGEYAVNGLTRLPESDFEALLSILNNLAAKLPARDCAGMLRSEDSFDIRWLELLAPDDSMKYLQLMKKAVIAEIKNAPRIAENSKEQREVALQALVSEVRRRLSPEKLELYDQTWAELDVAKDTDACWAYRVLLTSILDLPEMPRRWMVREYANILRPPK